MPSTSTISEGPSVAASGSRIPTVIPVVDVTGILVGTTSPGPAAAVVVVETVETAAAPLWISRSLAPLGGGAPGRRPGAAALRHVRRRQLFVAVHPRASSRVLLFAGRLPTWPQHD